MHEAKIFWRRKSIVTLLVKSFQIVWSHEVINFVYKTPKLAPFQHLCWKPNVSCVVTSYLAAPSSTLFPFIRNCYWALTTSASSCQSSWLQIQRSGFDSFHYLIFWAVVGLERGPLSLVSTTEELLERKSSGFSLESRDYGCKDPMRWLLDTPLSVKTLALTLPTIGGSSVSIVRARSQATEFSFFLLGPVWETGLMQSV
jgi:hypothetical protein